MAQLALLVGALISGTQASAADMTSVWDGTVGSWSDPSRWSTDPLVPNNGNGESTFDVEIGGGEVTLDFPVEIEAFDASNGVVTINGPTASLLASTRFDLGNGGTPTVAVSGGAALNTPAGSRIGISGGVSTMVTLSGEDTHWSGGDMEMGTYNQASGEVVVDAGSDLVVSGFVRVGRLGTGRLTVKGGGMFTTNGVDIGQSTVVGLLDRGWGKVEITGLGSTWTNNGRIGLGVFGNGFLNIYDGATVSSQDVIVGNLTSIVSPTLRGTGHVNVSGSGSTLSATNEIRIGPGWGYMTATDGGTVIATTGITVRENGSLTLDAGNIVGNTHIWTGGKLRGTGIVDGDVSNAGTLAPGDSPAGNSPGILDIVGNYTQEAGGTLAIEIGGYAPETAYNWVDKRDQLGHQVREIDS